MLRAFAVLAALALGSDRAAARAETAESESLLTAVALEDSIAPDSSGAASTDSALVPIAPRRDYLAEMRGNFTPENRAYWGIKTALRFIGPLSTVLVSLLVLFSGLSAKMRDVASNLGRSRWVRLLVYLGLYTLVMYALTFPVGWYDTFAVEHQYGLSNYSLPAWLADQGKSLMVGLFVLGVIPILWLIYTVIAWSPRRWWLWLALGTLPLVVAGTLLEPLVVNPLFNKFTRLRDPKLEVRILDLAQRAGIPGRNVYQVNQSQQTKKYNAYVSGFGVSQRIVLWDTTLEGMEEDEILFVTGHEIGHYALGHIWKGIAWSSLLAFAVLWLTASLSAWALGRFGPAWGVRELADPASLPLLAASLTLVLMVAQPVVNGFSRANETEADVYGLEITRDNDAAARAFLKLGEQNRSNPEPQAWARLVLYSHPTLAERVGLALTYRPWEEGKPNRLYRGR